MQAAIRYSSFFKSLFESEALLKKKWEDHRAFCAAMFVMPALVGTSHWVWDYITDPIGAQRTIGWRLLFLSSLVFPFAFKYIDNRRLLEVASIGLSMTGITVFVVILNIIHTGMIYGIGGFTFFLFVPLLMFQGFSVQVNLFSTFLFAAYPQLLFLVGFAHGFENAEYTVLIWPAAIAIMMAHYAFAHNYRLRYESELALESASNTDAMTGMYNRRYFMPLLQHEILRGNRMKRSVSLMLMDIDHFKVINDTYGHPTGDVVICALASICRKTARQVDVIARVGGEEFAILLPETDLAKAHIAAERIRKAVEDAQVKGLDGMIIPFTVSIGVAEQPFDHLSGEKLIHLADTAMYQAKLAGRNCVRGLNYDEPSCLEIL